MKHKIGWSLDAQNLKGNRVFSPQIKGLHTSIFPSCNSGIQMLMKMATVRTDHHLITRVSLTLQLRLYKVAPTRYFHCFKTPIFLPQLSHPQQKTTVKCSNFSNYTNLAKWSTSTLLGEIAKFTCTAVFRDVQVRALKLLPENPRPHWARSSIGANSWRCIFALYAYRSVHICGLFQSI
jgi:hypothetical protein